MKNSSLNKLILFCRDFRHVFTIMWPEAKAFVKGRVALVLLFIVSSSVLMSLSPLAMKLVVDQFTARQSLQGMFAFILIGAYVFSQWSIRAINEFRNLIYGQVDRRINRILARQLFDHLMKLPLRYHLERKTGAVNQLITNGLQGFQIIIQQAIFNLLPVLIEIVTAGVVLFRLKQGSFFMLFATALGCFAAAFGITVFRIAKPALEAQKAQVNVTATQTDSLLNYETVKYFSAERCVNQKMDAALLNAETAWVRLFRVRTINGLSVATVFSFFFATTAFYGVWRVQQGLMTVGDFVLITMYMFQVTRPAEMVGLGLQQLLQGRALMEQLMEFVRQTPENHASEAQLAANGNGQLKFENVKVAYASDQALLQDVSFEVPSGGVLGIVGASGAGKSTLIRLLVRLVEAESGRILLDGAPISEMSLSQLRQSIAVVPQDSVLFDDTIRYNIEFGKPGSTQEDVVNAAKMAGIHEFIMSLPERYETRVGERGVKLSGGEKQRIAIARAAIKQPKVYAFDEATSALDNKTEAQILNNLRDISRGRTTLLITHRLSTVVHADQIVLLHEGSIAESGTHESLLRLNGRYASLWQTQARANVA